MGCCSSKKSHTERDGAADVPRGDLSKALNVCAATTGDGSSVESGNNNQLEETTSMTMLMDHRSSGIARVMSDSDPTPSSPPGKLESERTSVAQTSRENKATTAADGSETECSRSSKASGNGTDSAPDSTRAPEPTCEQPENVESAGSPHENMPLQPSPRKVAPVNFDDLPINSMYHRIHVVEAEALDAKRQAELRAEAEQHELEVRAFKAATHRAP